MLLFGCRTVQQCPDPGEVVNGARSVRPEAGFAVGTVVRFSCNQGYQLEGPSQISCHGRDTGTPKWSDRSPKCVCESVFCFPFSSFPCETLKKYVLVFLSSEVWSVPKPWRPWQRLPNVVQAQLPGRRNSALLLLWGLWTHRWGHYQLRPRSSIPVEQPTSLLQRYSWDVCTVMDTTPHSVQALINCVYDLGVTRIFRCCVWKCIFMNSLYPFAFYFHPVAYEELLDDHKLEGDFVYILFLILWCFYCFLYSEQWSEMLHVIYNINMTW